MGESLQGVAFCLALGFISKTPGEGRNLLLAGRDLESPRLDKGVRQEDQDFLDQRLDPRCCWSVPFRCAMRVAVCTWQGALTSKETGEKPKTPRAFMHWTRGEWEKPNSHKLKQMPSHGTELLFPCDREHRFLCWKGSFPPNACDVLVCAALTLSWRRVCFSRLRSHIPAFFWPFVL